MLTPKPSAGAMRAAKTIDDSIEPGHDLAGPGISIEEMAEIIDRETHHVELVEALRGIFKLIESGMLVRDTSGDGQPGWAMKQMPLVRQLGQAQKALALAEEQP